MSASPISESGSAGEEEKKYSIGIEPERDRRRKKKVESEISQEREQNFTAWMRTNFMKAGEEKSLPRTGRISGVQFVLWLRDERANKT